MATRTRKAVPSPTLAEALRFVDMRRVDPLVLRFPGDEAFKPTPLFAHLTLADHERKQLGFIFRLNSSSRDLTDDMVVRSSYAFFELRGDDVILQNAAARNVTAWNTTGHGALLLSAAWDATRPIRLRGHALFRRI